jgi:hypothetical protein
MIAFLRFLGVTNAALWFGASVFFSLSIWPAFSSNGMLSLLGRPHAGAAAQLVLERYFLLHQLCAAIALFHLVAEALYLGRIIHRLSLTLLLTLLTLGLVGGYALQPRLESLHTTKYHPTTLEEDRAHAEFSFRLWQGVSWTLNLILVGGVWVHLIRVTRAPDTSRYRFS